VNEDLAEGKAVVNMLPQIDI